MPRGVPAGMSLLVVTALWVGHGGVQDLTGGGALSATGRLLGLWSSLLLIQVLLMARIPMVERTFGPDRLARWHRSTGATGPGRPARGPAPASAWPSSPRPPPRRAAQRPPPGARREGLK